MADSRATPFEIADVVVVGSGAAGLAAALAAAETVHVTILTDRKLGRSNSLMAQGGLQVPAAGADEQAAMISDMIAAGRGLASPERVRAFVDRIPLAIELLTSLAVDFDRDEDGNLVRRLAGGLSRPRIISAKDQIGPRVMTALRKAVLERRITVHELASVEAIEAITVEARPAFRLTYLQGEEQPEDQPVDRARRTITARAVVVATGGKTFAYAQAQAEPTTNPANQNEHITRALEGLGLCEQSRDLFQYHPFGIVRPVKARGKCVPETISNYAIDIEDRDGTTVCNTRTDRLAMVAAMKRAHEEGRSFAFERGEWGFKLAVPDARREAIQAAFPKIAGLLGAGEEPILVRPILHYYLGGFPIGTSHESPVPGLFLAGEITTGLFGASRLMGTGLLDSLVGGIVAGRNAAARARAEPGARYDLPLP